MQPIRWGVLSTANIARLVIGANRGSEVTRFVAVASRDHARARRFAAEQGLEASFGSYEALLASDLVDAVYVALPVSMHTPWASGPWRPASTCCARSRSRPARPTRPAALTPPRRPDAWSWRGSRGATIPRPSSPAGCWPRGRSAGWRPSGRR